MHHSLLQDSSELLNEVLDGLHEDLNEVKVKQATDKVCFVVLVMFLILVACFRNFGSVERVTCFRSRV